MILGAQALIREFTRKLEEKGLKRREGLCRFLGDGRLEMDTNTAERAIRPITLNRKTALFAGSDEGGAAWGVIA